MFHSCLGTDWLLVGEGGVSFGLPRVLVCVNVNGRLAKSAVDLDTQREAPLVPIFVTLTPIFEGKSYAYPDGANMFEEFSHLLQVGLLSQPCDVDGAVLRVVLLFRPSCKNKKCKCTERPSYPPRCQEKVFYMRSYLLNFSPISRSSLFIGPVVDHLRKETD